jgi:hypothetical protein
MTTKIKLERRAVEGILSSVVGGAGVSAIVQKSWWLAGLAVVVAIALLITEKADLEEEE